MYDHTLPRGRKTFSRYCLQDFSTQKILKSHAKDCHKINGKQMVKMSIKARYVRFKNYKRTIKFPFMIYAHFKSILMPENNRK